MKYISTLILTLFGCYAMSQDCGGSKGTFNDLNSGTEGKICFVRVVQNVADVYSSAYTISTPKGKELIKVDIIFDKRNKDITINTKDIEGGTFASKLISYEDDYSQIVIKNYLFNDTLIDSSDNYAILFSIPDTTEPYASLNQLTTAGSNINYRLEKFRPAYFKKHLAAVRAYYSKHQPITLKTVIPVAEEKPQLCQRCIDSLKVKMDVDADAIISRVLDSANNTKTRRVPAGEFLQNQFNQRIDDIFRNDLPKLNVNSFHLNQTITLAIGTGGNLLSLKDTFKYKNQYGEEEAYSAYSNLWKETIKPDILLGSFAPEQLLISTPGMYHAFYEKYHQECLKLDTSMNSFSDFFNIKRIRMDSLSSIKVPLPTEYKYHVTFIEKEFMRKWRLKKNHLITDLTNRELDSSGLTITDPDLKKSFFDNKVKKKLGRYHVILHSTQFLNEPPLVHLDSVKRKYIFYTYVGVTTGIEIPFGPTGTRRTAPAELVLVEGMIVHHWFGFFGGAAVYNNQINGDYKDLSPKPLYFEAGMYLGPCNYLYFKLGYSQLNINVVNKYGMSGSVHPGFISGISLLFPYVHIEGGYNMSVNSIYVNAGLNIPINR